MCIRDRQKIMAECEERDVEEWINGDQELENETFADEEIISVVCQQTDIDEDGIIEEKEEDSKGEVSHKDALEALQLAVRYVEQQGEASGVDVLFMRKWRDHAFKNSFKLKKQKTITDFFKV